MVEITEEPPTQQKTHRLLFALVIAAPLADALASALHPAMPDDAERLLAVVDGTGRWYLMSLLGLVASGLVVAAAVVLGRWVRTRSPFLGTIAMVSAFVGGVLMASMQGFKLFLPTLARLAPVDGATAVGEFIGSASFAPMVGGFMLRALGWILLGVAAAKSGIVSWRTALLVGIGAILAFLLPPAPTRWAGSSLPSASVSSPTEPSPRRHNGHEVRRRRAGLSRTPAADRRRPGLRRSVPGTGSPPPPASAGANCSDPSGC